MAEGSQSLSIEKEHTRCAFGQWYYGDEREKLEELIPELKSVFTKIEKPHQNLHESSKEIGTLLNSHAEKKLLNMAFNDRAQVNIKLIGQLLNEAEQIIENKMNTGEIGMKTGKGFYSFEGRNIDEYQVETLRKFVDLLKHLGYLTDVKKQYN